jgi:putative PLP-dependent aminotransferase (TIGR04422 family)
VVNSINITGKSASTSLPGYVRDVNYNQWGIVLNKQENLFLSDCADSFYPIGGKVCDLNSRFEVWSLPKILGTTFGGVIWCRDLSDAQSLRNLRNTFPRENLLYEIYHDISKRLGGKFYFNWEKRKFNRPNLNFHQINELDRILFDWNAIYRERSELFLEQFTRIHNSDRAKAVKVLSENKGVIPVVIDNLGSTKSRDGTMLHRILPDGFCEKIEICAYQSRIKRRRNYR